MADAKYFPADRNDALAMLYLQAQDLTDKTPEEIADMYSEAYSKIKEKLLENDKQKREEQNKAHPYNPIMY